MKALFLVFFILVLNFGHAQENVVVLNHTSALNIVSGIQHLNNAVSFKLSQSELENTIELIEQLTGQMNQRLKSHPDIYGEWELAQKYEIHSLDKYYLQIVPFLNDQGEQEIWLNGFCKNNETLENEYKNWKSELLIFEKTQKCNFQLRINLETKLHVSALRAPHN